MTETVTLQLVLTRLFTVRLFLMSEFNAVKEKLMQSNANKSQTLKAFDMTTSGFGVWRVYINKQDDMWGHIHSENDD